MYSFEKLQICNIRKFCLNASTQGQGLSVERHSVGTFLATEKRPVNET
jgi:hypothetical protein